MNILVVNDDGIEALGVHKLAEALSEAGDVYVCAPHEQQSATGHGITISRPVHIRDVQFKEAKQAVAMEGTPADCVKIGLEVYRNRNIEIDMVFSGFNHGMNLGTDTLYSGTVSAAVEGAICGLPSAAMSISTNFTDHRTPKYFELAMELALGIARSYPFSKYEKVDPNAYGLDFIRRPHALLNVNIPNLPREDIKGVKVCPLSYGSYDEWFKEHRDSDGRSCYQYAGSPRDIGEAPSEDSDIVANRLGYATITPLCFDLTDYAQLEFLRKIYNS